MITIDSLSVRRDGRTLSDGVTMHLAEGAVHGFSGTDDAVWTALFDALFGLVRPDAGGVTVGFDGIAARIARIHQYGLQDEVGPGAYAQYPARELLGMTPADLIATENAVISSLGGAS